MASAANSSTSSSTKAAKTTKRATASEPLVVGNPAGKLAFKSTDTAWSDRWHKPEIEALLEPIRPHQQKPMTQVIEELDAIEGLERDVIWFGSSWKWTIQYALPAIKRGEEREPVCYVVPSDEQPLVCVPMDQGLIDTIPTKNQGKFIRDGLSGAKGAVAIQWATWSPASANDVVQLMEIVARKLETLVPPTPA